MATEPANASELISEILARGARKLAKADRAMEPESAVPRREPRAREQTTASGRKAGPAKVARAGGVGAASSTGGDGAPDSTGGDGASGTSENTDTDDQDRDPVHALRAAMRRMRAYLRTFRPFLDLQWSTDLAVDLRWYGGSLGAVRDLDVIYAFLAGTRLEPTWEPFTGGVDRLAEVLLTQRAARYADFLEIRASTKAGDLAERLARCGDGIPLGSRADGSPGKLLTPLVRRTRREVQDAEKAMRARPTLDNLHDLRKKAKNLRYVCESLDPVLGKQCTRLSSEARATQDHIGPAVDAASRGRWLEDAATWKTLGHGGRLSAGAAQAIFAAGRLSAEAAAEVEAALAAWR